MEDSVIKSPSQPANMSEEISSIDNPKVKTIIKHESILASTSSGPVDDTQKNSQSIDNPDHASRDKNHDGEISHKGGTFLLNKKLDCIYTTDTLPAQNQPANQNNETIVEDSKDSENLSSTITKENAMTKPFRNRISSKEKTKNNSDQIKPRKSVPVRNSTRKVLIEKQIRSVRSCNKSGILLRSNTGKSADLLRKNSPSSNVQRFDNIEITKTSKNKKDSSESKAQMSDESKIIETFKNRNNPSNDEQPSNEENHSSANKENILEVSSQNSDSPSLGNGKEVSSKITMRKTIPYEGLRLAEKILIKDHNILEDTCNRSQLSYQNNDDKSLKDEQKSMANGGEDSTKIEIVSKKRYHRRKCSEPFKTERIQTRQSRNITLMQNKNEYKYVSQVSNTVKSIALGSGEGSGEKTPQEECVIICTPDININIQTDEPISDENQNPVSSLDRKHNNESGNKEDLHSLNSTKENPAKKILPPKKIDSINSRISPKETNRSKAGERYPESCKKRGQGNADEYPKRILRHVNVYAMPVYTSKIAASKNETESKSSLPLSQIKNKGHASGNTSLDKAEKRRESPITIKKETPLFNYNITLRSKVNRTTDSKLLYSSNTDSEDTLSNVESIPNSPAQETWPKVAGTNFKFSNKSVKPNSGQSITRRRNMRLVTQPISTGMNLGIVENNRSTALRSARKRKRSETVISKTLNSSTKRHKPELQYYVETSESQNPSRISDSSEKNADEDGVGNDVLGGPQATPWLRHYERPNNPHADITKNVARCENDGKEHSLQQNENLYNQYKRDDERNKKTDNVSIIDTTVPDYLKAAEQRLSRNSSVKPPLPVNERLSKNRGRPRKKNVQVSSKNSEQNDTNKPSVNATLNGSGLSKLELERLFFKFLQHGHFRIEPEQPTIIIHSNDLYQKFSARIQCYDPRNLHEHSHNLETKSNSESKIRQHTQQHFSTINDSIRFNPSNSSTTRDHVHRLKTINPTQFSNNHIDQARYSKNLSPCSTHTNIQSYNENTVSNTSGYNTHMSLASNCKQSAYSTAPNYHQNIYNNSANLIGNNSYFNGYSGIVNSNDYTNDSAATNLLFNYNNFDDDFNLILNADQEQNSVPCKEIDFNVNNGNTISNHSIDSIQNCPTNNMNTDWNLTSINQHLDSVNELLMDLNSINDANESHLAIDTSSDLNNIMNNTNSGANGLNPWMSRSNNMMNPRFPVLPPWHTSLPMYNSFFNNSNPYPNNTLNPYAALMGFDQSNYSYSNMKSKNCMGNNNENAWMQNILPSSDGDFTLNTANTEFSDMDSGSLPENTSNQRMHLSLSNDTILSQTNSIRLEDANLVMGNGSRLSPNINQQGQNTFVQIETNNQNDNQQNARGYGGQLCSLYSLEHKNEEQNPNFNIVERPNIDGNTINIPQEQNLPDIKSYMNQSADSLEGNANQSYRRAGSPTCEVIPELPNNKEIQMVTLRQELVDFTRQYSEEETNSLSQIPQGDEVFI